MSKEVNNKRITIIVVLVLLAALIGGGTWLYNKLGDGLEHDNLVVQNQGGDQVQSTAVPNPSESNQNEVDTDRVAAEDFTVYDKSGKKVRLADFKGKPVVLNFWASWCGPCKSEMPDFDKVYREYGDEIHFLMVNLTDGYQETKQKAVSFVEDSGYTFPVYFDSDTDAAMKYGISSIPTTYFIDEEGYFVAQGRGALDYAALMQGIAMLK